MAGASTSHSGEGTMAYRGTKANIAKLASSPRVEPLRRSE
jgi:hypothetical protein